MALGSVPYHPYAFAPSCPVLTYGPLSFCYVMSGTNIWPYILPANFSVMSGTNILPPVIPTLLLRHVWYQHTTPYHPCVFATSCPVLLA